MLNVTIYIALGLGLLLALVYFGSKLFFNRQIRAVREMELNNPEYSILDDERERILVERANIETEHPYQKLLALRFRLERAEADSNEDSITRLREMIESIFVEHDTDDEKLAMAYRAQIDAMNRRLNEIELKLRHMRIVAKSETFSLSRLFKDKTG